MVRFGGLQVDGELEPGPLNDRQVGGLSALEDLTRIKADLTIHIGKVGSIAHQPIGNGGYTRKEIAGIAWEAAPTMSRSRRLPPNNGSAVSVNADTRCVTSVAKKRSMSRSLLAWKTMRFSPRERAAASNSSASDCAFGLIGFSSAAMVVASGRRSCCEPLWSEFVGDGAHARHIAALDG